MTNHGSWNHQPAGSCHLNGRITQGLYLQKMTLLSNYNFGYFSGRNDHHQYKKMFRITGNAVIHFSSFPIQLSALQNEIAEQLPDRFLMIKYAACIIPYVLLLVCWGSNKRQIPHYRRNMFRQCPFPRTWLNQDALKSFVCMI